MPDRATLVDAPMHGEKGTEHAIHLKQVGDALVQVSEGSSEEGLKAKGLKGLEEVSIAHPVRDLLLV